MGTKGDTPISDRGTVLVAEDHAPLRTGLVTALRRAGFTAEGAESGQAAASRLLSRAFEVLLADINMPGNAQLELLSQAKALGIAVLLMTGEPSVDTAIGALQGGAIDYLKKPIAPELLVQRLDAAVVKARAAGATGTLSGLAPDELERLSLREREVVALLAVGNPPKEIATRLGLSANTVRNHIKSIFAKLRVHSQVELLLKLRSGER